MAEFEISYDYLKSLEGLAINLGYANRKTDLGKETLGGRSKYWKVTKGKMAMDIEIFRRLDELKKDPSFPSNLHHHEVLSFLIRTAYEQDEWRAIKGDMIPDQEVANEAFEFAVHKNPQKSISILQYCASKLNYNGTLFGDLEEDGKMGVVTAEAISILMTRPGDISTLVKMFNCEQGHFYIERFTQSPSQEANARGFFRRVEIQKKP